MHRQKGDLNPTPHYYYTMLLRGIDNENYFKGGVMARKIALT